MSESVSAFALTSNGIVGPKNGAASSDRSVPTVPSATGLLAADTGRAMPVGDAGDRDEEGDADTGVTSAAGARRRAVETRVIAVATRVT